jgi:hypothetical protein
MNRSRQPAAPAPLASPRARAPRSGLQRAATSSATARSLESLQRLADARGAPVQRASLEEEEPLMGRFVQRAAMEEEEPLMGRFVQRAAQAPAPAGGLPAPLRAGVEALSGQSLADVRVHYDSPEPAGVAAHAFAQGDEIHLAPGQDRHLPHEAWHVVQQRQGRVRPNTSVNGIAVNDDPTLETEADVMGARSNSAGTQMAARRRDR